METEPKNNTKKTGRQARLIALMAAAFVLVTALAWVVGSFGADAGTALGQSPLQISEYMSSNSVLPDPSGNFSDWVEIHNTGTSAVSLNGYALESGQKAGMLPDIELEPGGYVLVYCDGSSGREGHASFRLKAAGGETLNLKNPSGQVVDSTTTIPLETNVSAVRGDGAFTAAPYYTPGYPNTEDGHAAWQASRVAESTDLVLNEIMPANTVSIPDGDGDYADYIEIRNTSDTAINLLNYGLSNDRDAPLKWRFPERTLGPGEVLLVFASGKGYSADPDELHAGFKIDKASDTIYLSAPDGTLLDSVEINGMDNDVALRREADGRWVQTSAVSPGQPNTDDGVEAFWKALDAQRTGLRISEVMTRNSTIACIAGVPYDWVELYNPTDQPISLAGYTLSDDVDNPGLFALPDVTIPAGGYRVIYCTGERVNGSASYIQATFTLGGGDGAVALYKDGVMVDGVGLSQIPINGSKGRRDGGAGFYFFTSPTLGTANGTGGQRDVTAVPAAATKAGIYDDVDKVEVSLSGEGTIYYTTDGNLPTTSSNRYTGPFALTATTAVRAIAVKDGAVPSDVLTVSYIINEHHTLDVVSLVSPPDGLFSRETGIYVAGSGSDEYPYTGANYMKRGVAWERAGNIELFPQNAEEDGFSIGCGIRIFGGMSRGYAKKSLSIRFKDCYGASTLNYPLFSSRDNWVYNSFLLRSGGQDFHKAIIRDILTTSLVDDEDLMPVQAYRQVVLYINGEYWGLHNIREKIDEDFIAAHENVLAESVDLLKGDVMVKAGSDKEYRELLAYIEDRNFDLSDPEAYRYVTDRIDVQNYADFLIAEIYCANNDAGNIRYYRSSQDDNKWRWILFDTDLGFAHKSDQIWYLINPEGTGYANAFRTTIINGLLSNADFRQLFLERLEYNMKNTFSTERVLARIDELAAAIEPEVKRNFERWPSGYSWESCIEQLRSFAKNRQSVIKKEFLESAQVAAKFGYTKEQLDQCFE